MSNAALTAVWHARITKAGAKMVLAVLADHAGDHEGEDWTCFPSIARIARFSGQDTRTVERHLIFLVADAWIRRIRLRRKDGTMAGYRYRLNRQKLLAELSFEVSDGEPLDWDEGLEEPLEPDDNLSGGPPDKCDATTRQSVPQPHDKLSGQEPSIERTLKEEPSLRARDPALSKTEARKLFDRSTLIYPAKGRKVTRWPEARKVWQRASIAWGAERLAAAVEAYSCDRDVAAQNFIPGLHTWLESEMFKAFLPDAYQPSSDPLPRQTPFAAPDDVMAVVDDLDLAPWLTGASFRAEDRTIVCPLQFAADRVAGKDRKALRGAGLSVEGPQGVVLKSEGVT